MPILRTLQFRAGLLSLVILLVFLGIWAAATTGPSIGGASTGMTAEQIEYAKMMGKDPGAAKSGGFPTLGQMATTVWGHVTNPFYDNGPNDKGIAIQLAHSLGRVALGFGLACLVAIPLGFVIGMSPLLRKAFDPFI
jgi:nitrate/nitrite transport system permease protein